MAQLSSSIEELVRKKWSTMEVFTLSSPQEKKLLVCKEVIITPYTFPANKIFPEHQHDKAQMLLVEEGELTHYAQGKEYVQHSHDILIVPVYLQHTAKVGNKNLKIYHFHQKSEAA